MHTDRIVDLSVIIIYMLLMAGVGAAFKNASKDISDYFRAGAKGTWWLIGTSVFMGGFTAITFTGIAGQAFLGGWSVLTIFWAGVFSAFIQGIFFAPWFRQIRAITGLDVNYERFGRSIEQAYGYFGLFSGSMWSAIQLYGLSLFVSAIFGLQVELVILFVGAIIVFYSVTGGSWAVLATDFLQAMILLPITVLVAVLSLHMVGGIDGLFAAIRAQDLVSEFAIIKPQGWQPSLSGTAVVVSSFTLGWTFFQYLGSTVNAANLQQAYKYFSVKDGHDAKKAAIFSGILRLIGSFIFFIPPIVARLVIPEEVMGLENIDNPMDASYAVISMHVLPAGMLGLVVIAMFTATMSTMDTGLTHNAGNVTKNLYPVFMRLIGKKPREGMALLNLGRMVNLVLGLMAVAFALQMALVGSRAGLFGIMLDLGALLGLPMTMPFIWGLFIRKAPEWSGLASVVGAGIVSFFMFFDDLFFQADFSWQFKWSVVFIGGSIGWFVSMPFWKTASPAYKEKVNRFFERMHRPVDFAEEVGEANDRHQLKVLGRFGVLMGALMMLLCLVPSNHDSIAIIIWTALSVIGVSALMVFFGTRSPKSGD